MYLIDMFKVFVLEQHRKKGIYLPIESVKEILLIQMNDLS